MGAPSTHFVTRMLINSVAILLIAYFSRSVSPGLLTVDSFLAAIAAAFVLGLVNAVLKPVFVILTLPLTLVTFGLFLLVVNGTMLWIVQALVPGFRVGSFGGAILVSVLVSLVSWIMSRLVD